MVVGDDTNITKGGPTSTRGFLRRALTQRGSGISPDVLVAHDVDDELTTAPLSQSAAQNVVRNSFIAGSLSGMASILILYPMDFIRTNLQTAGIPNAAAAAATTTSAPKGAGGSVSSSLAVSTATGRTTAVASVPGPWHILRQTFQTGGIRALYTGITLPLMAQAVFKGTVFSVNNILEQAILDFRSSYYHQRDGIETKLTAADRLFCGFVAGMVNGGIFVTPVEYVRNQVGHVVGRVFSYCRPWVCIVPLILLFAGLFVLTIRPTTYLVDCRSSASVANSIGQRRRSRKY